MDLLFTITPGTNLLCKCKIFLYKMYVTIKLDDKGYKIHGISDGDKEIVMDKDYFVMPKNMVNTRCRANMPLKEAKELIKEREEERRLVCEFEAKHNMMK